MTEFLNHVPPLSAYVILQLLETPQQMQIAISFCFPEVYVAASQHHF